MDGSMSAQCRLKSGSNPAQFWLNSLEKHRKKYDELKELKKKIEKRRRGKDSD